jgi:hypothetical protein
MDPDLDPKRRHSIDLTVACPTNHEIFIINKEKIKKYKIFQSYIKL